MFIARLVIGVYFITHGYSHFAKRDMLAGYAQSRGMKGASVMLPISGAAIILGGLALIFGVYAQLALVGLAVFLVLTSFMVHNFWKDTDPMKRMQERTSFESNIALAAALLLSVPFVYFWMWTL